MVHHILLVLAMVLAGERMAFAKSERSVLEAAPLQGALGQVSARFEGAGKGAVFFGGQIDLQERPGERVDRPDTLRRVSFEAVQYPSIWQLDGLFVAAGLDYEFAQIGRRRDRDYVSTIRYTEDERYDLWTNEDHYFLAHVGAGYRFFAGKYATASLRYTHESLLFSHGEVRRETIYSLDPNLTSHGRARQDGRISMFVGVSLD